MRCSWCSGLSRGYGRLEPFALQLIRRSDRLRSSREPRCDDATAAGRTTDIGSRSHHRCARSRDPQSIGSPASHPRTALRLHVLHGRCLSEPDVAEQARGSFGAIRKTGCRVSISIAVALLVASLRDEPARAAIDRHERRARLRGGQAATASRSPNTSSRRA